MTWVIMLYIINSIRLIKPVNNEVGHNDNKAARGAADSGFALKTDSRCLSYVTAAAAWFQFQDNILIYTRPFIH